MRFTIYLEQLLVLLFVDSTLSNPIKKLATGNVVVQAQIGQTVNISCYFDPSINFFPQNNINEQIASSQFKNKRNNKRTNSYYHKASGTQQQQNVFKSVKFTDIDHEDVEPNENKIDYEIDWFFLDNQGRMNIISYGEETTQKYKYKTFFKNENQPQSQLRINDQGGYSSSALYSQSSRSEKKTRYTYYLSALIESQEDEGVYQCINPFKPNHVIRNVTVLISRNIF